MLWGITCSCFLLEQNYGKNGGKWIPSSGCKRWILWGLAHCKRLLSQRAPHIFPSGFYMDMGWELNYVWNNIRPGHETFNSLHPIFSFLKKVPPLTEQKEQEMCWCHDASWSLSHCSSLPLSLPQCSRYLTGPLPSVLCCKESKSPSCLPLLFTGLAIN